MTGASRWTWGEGLLLAAGLGLFFLLESAYLQGPIFSFAPAQPAQPAQLTGPATPSSPATPFRPETPFQGQKGFLDAQFWIFTTTHRQEGLAATHGLPAWQTDLPEPSGAAPALAVHNSHPPLVALLGGAAALLLGPTPTAARLPALLLSLVAVGLMYVLLRRSFPRLAACLGVIGLVTQPLFFHFATCPEVFLLGHVPLLALLTLALRTEPPVAAGESSASSEVPSPARRCRPRPRLIGLAALAALCVATSYSTLGVLALWCLAWTAYHRCRAAWLDAAAVVGGAAGMLLLLLCWLHLGGGSVSHWAERGILRIFSSAGDRPELGDAPAATWSALFEHQAVWLFQGAGWLAWLGLIGCGLYLTSRWQAPAETGIAPAPNASDASLPSPPGAPAVASEIHSSPSPSPDPSLVPPSGQGRLLTALALMFLCEGFLIKQNAITHAYSVAASGFLISFGLAAIGEQAVLGFRALTLRSGFQTRHLVAIILMLATLGAIYRLSESIDQQQALTLQTDITPLATAIDQAQLERTGQPVLVYDEWLLPARTVTGREIPLHQGYIFPWFYRGRAFLCYRQPELEPAHFQSPGRPGVVLWPADRPWSGSVDRSAAIQAELRQQGYQSVTIQGVAIYTRSASSRESRP